MSRIKFTAIIEKELYYNKESCYGIYKFGTMDAIPESESSSTLFSKSELCYSTLAGSMQQLYEGQEYKIEAELINNSKYGYQYKPHNISKDIPKTKDDIRDYLLSVINETDVDMLLEQYPNIVQDLINDNGYTPDLSNLKGIKDKKFEKIRDKILETYIISDILALLSPLGVTFTMIKKIASKESNATLLKQKLIDNPYQLIGRVPNLTFLKVDKFALELNPELKYSEKRIFASISYALRYIGENDGHTVVPVIVLNKEIKKLLYDIYPYYLEFMKEEVENPKQLYVENGYVGLRSYYFMEKYIWDKLNAINQTENIFKVDNIDEKIKETNEKLGFELSEEQESLVRSVVDKNVIVLSGKSGTGKTSTLKGIIETYSDKCISIVTLSAMAARRASEVTGHEASTIHRFLGYGKDGDKFTYNEENNFFSEILIIDESSMVNMSLFYSLLKATPTYSKIIIVGDEKQLPPIGAGATFFDLLNEKNDFHCIKLSNIFRQAQKSGIIMDANTIRDGMMPFENIVPTKVTGELKDMFYIFNENANVLQQSIIDTFLQYVKNGTSLDDISIIVPKKESCRLSTKEINTTIQNALIPSRMDNELIYGDKIFRTGCKMMNTVNNYDKDVLNGEIGTLLNFYKKEKNMVFNVKFQDDKTVEFDLGELKNFELAYCLTVHKIQGGQRSIIIIGIEKSHYMLLSCNLIYTAITRAVKKCIVFSQPVAFNMGVRNKKEQRRLTFWNQCGIIGSEVIE